VVYVWVYVWVLAEPIATECLIPRRLYNLTRAAGMSCTDKDILYTVQVNSLLSTLTKPSDAVLERCWNVIPEEEEGMQLQSISFQDENVDAKLVEEAKHFGSAMYCYR
jgi:hypothetical protein